MMEGLAVKQASHAASLREYGQPAKDALSLVVCQRASSAHPESSAVAAGQQRTLVPPRLRMPGGTALPCSAIGSRALAQTIPSPKASSLAMDIPAVRTASPRQQLACLPLPTATTTASGMPCPATACEPRSICAVPCTPTSSLCTCKVN
jgi:hypothetical protein